MKKTRKVKSINFLIINTMVTLNILLISLISSNGEAQLPYWHIILLSVYVLASLVFSFSERRKDIKDATRIHDLKKYITPHIIIFLAGMWLVCAQDILVNSSQSKPVDYSVFPAYLLHTLGYFFYTTLIVMFTISIVGLISKIRKTKESNNTSVFKIIVSTLFFGLLYVLFKQSLVFIWRYFYGFYDTTFSRYGDIASIYCIFAGIYSSVLIMIIQNNSRFIPFKYHNKLVNKVLEFDAKERANKKKQRK